MALANLGEHDIIVVAQVSQLTANGIILSLLHIVELTARLVKPHYDSIHIFKRHRLLTYHLEDILTTYALYLLTGTSGRFGKFVVMVRKTANHVNTGGLKLAVLDSGQITIGLGVTICEYQSAHVYRQTRSDVRQRLHCRIQVFRLDAECGKLTRALH